jgi:hypothetical protein
MRKFRPYEYCFHCKREINNYEKYQCINSSRYYLHIDCAKVKRCDYCDISLYNIGEWKFIHTDLQRTIKCSQCISIRCECNICYEEIFIRGARVGKRVNGTHILVHKNCLKEVNNVGDVCSNKKWCSRYIQNYARIFFPGWSIQTHRFHSDEVKTAIKTLLLVKKRGGIWACIDKNVVLNYIIKYIATPEGWKKVNGKKMRKICTPFRCQDRKKCPKCGIKQVWYGPSCKCVGV